MLGSGTPRSLPDGSPSVRGSGGSTPIRRTPRWLPVGARERRIYPNKKDSPMAPRRCEGAEDLPQEEGHPDGSPSVRESKGSTPIRRTPRWLPVGARERRIYPNKKDSPMAPRRCEGAEDLPQ